MWFWANDSKHKHIIYHWKWFFATINNLRLLPENKASFGTDQLSKFWQFTSKSVLSNLVTFITNGRYRYDRGDERNLLEPWAIVNHGRRRQIKAIFSRPFSRATTTFVDGAPTTEKLPSPPTDVLWSISYDSCKKLRLEASWSGRGREVHWERKRRREVERGRSSKRERERELAARVHRR